MLLEEKLEGRKAQSLPFLLSRNMKYHTLKNVGFCPNEVIHFNPLLALPGNDRGLFRFFGGK
jgi:hypothetical protein